MKKFLSLYKVLNVVKIFYIASLFLFLPSNSFSHPLYKESLEKFKDKEVAVRHLNIVPVITSLEGYEHNSVLVSCKNKLEKGMQKLSIQDLCMLVEALDDYVTRSGERGLRPDAPPLIANDAVVGKSCCDLTQVIALLGALKKLLVKIEIDLCEKFEFTWSILEKIDIDINGIFTALDALECPTVDITGIFTALEFDFNNIQTIICEKFEFTWSILEKIDIDINGIYTALDALQCPTVDLTGIFTALEFDFNNIQTIICEKFEFTWSALEKIDIDINGIYTVLENLNITLTIGELNINVTIDVDLSGVFTALEFDFNNIQTIICEKFEFTWSALEKIDIDVNGIFTALDALQCPTVDITGIFTALEFDFNNIQTIICEKFEFTWSILEKIDIDINGIYTALNDITVNATIDVDLSGIFTALEFDFNNIQTIICEKFEFTWSILEKIDIDINGIYTALNDITVNATIDVDLSGIFTALEFDFNNIQTIICEKFEFTWSILEKIDIDINGIYTVLENLNITLTIGELNINVTIDVDLSGVFTALEFDFNNIQTIICEKFEFTWSALEKIDIDVNGIFTALDALQCPTVDLTGIFTALEFGFYDTQTIICEKFQFTWTILDCIEMQICDALQQLDEQIIDLCCQQNGLFQETWTILQEIICIEEQIFDDVELLGEQIVDLCCQQKSLCQETCTILGPIAAALCSPQEIRQAYVGVSTYTISQPGFYVFAENIIFSPASGQPALEITTDNVTIDMCGKTLRQGNAVAGVDGIRVPGNTTLAPRSHITIMNGGISSFTRSGIVVGTNPITPANTAARFINLNDLTISGCSRDGVEFASTTTISDIKLKNLAITSALNGISLTNVNRGLVAACDLVVNTTGAMLNQSNKICFKECKAEENIQAGFWLQNSSNNIFTACNAIGNGQDGTTNAYGFISANGRGNIFEQCNACCTITTQTTQDFIAAGFALTSSEMCSKIITCESFDNTATGSSIAYGIFLESTQTTAFSFVATFTGVFVNALSNVAWNPSGTVLAYHSLAPLSTDFSAYGFNGESLFLITTSQVGSLAADVYDWSPDGQFLAIGGAAFGSLSVQIFSFNGTDFTFITSEGGSRSNGFWSPAGQYIATVEPGANEVRIYSFNGLTLTLIDSASIMTPRWASWSSDGTYLAVSTASGVLQIYTFDGLTLTPVTNITTSPSNILFTSFFNPQDAHIIASVDQDFLYIFSFDGTTLLEEERISRQAVDSNFQVLATLIAWSPDGQFLTVSGRVFSPPTPTLLVNYLWDGTCLRLQSKTEILSPLSTSANGLAWSPSGKSIAFGSLFGTDPSGNLSIYDVGGTIPSKNIIKNNLVYCNGERGGTGVGILGSSFNNLIIGNTAFQNTNNYQLVNNVAITDAPTLLENISVPSV
ncbi:MAG: right-handed parallel beta-helix repeat-containing protein [Candidatus Babeliales bacterium]